MLRLFTCLLLAAAFLAAGCSKDDTSNNESQFYGKWSKGTYPGDTLQFMRKDGKDILRFNMSFNASLPAWQEVAYNYKNDKLGVQVFGPGADIRTLDSFTWQQPGKQFEILGFQLYLIMSSSVTKFSYTKIN